MWKLVRRFRVLQSLLVAGAYGGLAPDGIDGPMSRISFPFKTLRLSLTGNILPELNSRVGLWINEVDILDRQLAGSSLGRSFIDSGAIIDAGAKSLSLLLSIGPGILNAGNGVVDAAGAFMKWQSWANEPPPMLSIYTVFALGAGGIISDADGLSGELWGFQEE